MDASTEQVVWFQYRPGTVVESLRVTHCATPISHDIEVQSWCGLKFHGADVERTAGPGERPGAAEAKASAPCTACMLQLTAATAGPTDTPITDVDCASADNSKLAVVLRKAQWLLDDAAYYLPQGRCSRQEREALAATLDQLAALIRDQRPQKIDQANT